MKRSLLYLAFLSVIFVSPVIADVTVEETTDAEYLINAGYSQVMAEDVFMQKNRVNGKSIEPLYEKSQNRLIKACKRFYAYIDPAYENQDKLHHDIKPSTSASDL